MATGRVSGASQTTTPTRRPALPPRHHGRTPTTTPPRFFDADGFDKGRLEVPMLKSQVDAATRPFGVAKGTPPLSATDNRSRNVAMRVAEVSLITGVSALSGAALVGSLMAGVAMAPALALCFTVFAWVSAVIAILALLLAAASLVVSGLTPVDPAVQGEQPPSAKLAAKPES